MNYRDKAKVMLFVIIFLAMCVWGVYAGWKYPELYIIPIDGHHKVPGVGQHLMPIGKINIVNICGADPRQFQPFASKFWCIA